MAIFWLIYGSRSCSVRRMVKLCGSVHQGLSNLHRVCCAWLQLAQWRRQTLQLTRRMFPDLVETFARVKRVCLPS